MAAASDCQVSQSITVLHPLIVLKVDGIKFKFQRRWPPEKKNKINEWAEIKEKDKIKTTITISDGQTFTQRREVK